MGLDDFIIKQALGSKVISQDHYEYLDYRLCSGALIQGHAHRNTVLAIKKNAERGISFDDISREEIELKRLISRKIPFHDDVALFPSESEALRMAIQCAKKDTQKNTVLVLEGVKTRGLKVSCEICSFDQLMGIVEERKDDVACVVVDPLSTSQGLKPICVEFLISLRALCRAYRICLIFDERKTCFRTAAACVQSEWGVFADMTCLGGVLGAGFSLGAIGASGLILNDVLELKACVSQRVIFSAAYANLRSLNEGLYQKLNHKVMVFVKECNSFFEEHHLNVHMRQYASLISVHFCAVSDAGGGQDFDYYQRFVSFLKDKGILFPKEQSCPFVMSVRHSKKDCLMTVELIKQFFINDIQERG